MKRWHVATAAVLALVAGTVIGLAASPGGSGGSPTEVTEEASTAPTVPAESTNLGPTAVRAGMPVGFARTEQGARAAAMTYSGASQLWLYFADVEIEEAVAAIATPTAAPSLTREVVGEVGVAREALAASPGRVWWIVRPLATRVEAFTPDRARISVWTVTVLSATDVALPQSEWITVTVELVWSDGDWLVSAITDAAGPTPMLGPRDQPWQSEPLDDALEGFERIQVGEM